MQRISITVDESLAEAFDTLIAKRGYQIGRKLSETF